MKWVQRFDSSFPQTHQALICWRTQMKESYSAQSHCESSFYPGWASMEVTALATAWERDFLCKQITSLPGERLEL